MLLVSRVDRTKSAGVSNAFCEQTDKSRWLPPILLVFQMSHGLTINRLQLNGQKQLAVRIKEKKLNRKIFLVTSMERYYLLAVKLPKF